jgi:hypothetical protein
LQAPTAPPASPPPGIPPPGLPYAIPPYWTPTAAPAPLGPLAPPAQPERFDWALFATAVGGFYLIQYAIPLPNEIGGRGSGTLELDRYLAPVVDDDMPRSLQPFLQRASVVYVDFTGGGFATHEPRMSVSDTASTRSGENFGGGAGCNVYVNRWIALTGALGYGYDVSKDPRHDIDQHTHAFLASVGIGVRYEDTRLDLRYTYQAFDADGTWEPIRWGTLVGNLFTVPDRHVSVQIWGAAIQHGGQGGFQLGVYPTQNVNLFLGGYAEHGELFSDNDVIVNQYDLNAGLSYWFTPRLRLGAYYDFILVNEPLQTTGPGTYGSTQYQHVFTVEAALRIP